METDRRIKVQSVAQPDMGQFYKWAAALSFITIFYNLIEGVVSVFFGAKGEAVSLLGFGVDSFVEVISAVGVWHMVLRMKRNIKLNGAADSDRFERAALRITGGAFYLLTTGLAIASSINLYQGNQPKTAFWGIVISSLSILGMWALIHYKLKVGRRFNSRAMLADAACSKTCLYLSFVLLAASVGYELTGIGIIDSIGALGIAAFSFKEGREAFGKAKGKECGCAGACLDEK
ncbi:MAG: cation transporter [Nitrospiraceae bacterium]|nr:cation transporter [Nitrospiraceae bacterium]